MRESSAERAPNCSPARGHGLGLFALAPETRVLFKGDLADQGRKLMQSYFKKKGVAIAFGPGLAAEGFGFRSAGELAA